MAQTTEQRYRVAPVRPKSRQWPFPLNLYQSAVGRKWVMALTGIGLIGFVIIPWAGLLELESGRTVAIMGANINIGIVKTACVVDRIRRNEEGLR